MIALIQYGSVFLLIAVPCTLTIWLQNRRERRQRGDRS